jgi:hypothetical protein
VDMTGDWTKHSRGLVAALPLGVVHEGRVVHCAEAAVWPIRLKEIVDRLAVTRLG